MSVIDKENDKVKIIEFMQCNRRNGFASFGCVSLYLRRTRRVLGGVLRETLDVARIDAEQKGKGHATEFFSFVEEEAKKRNITIYVESILNDRFLRWLERRGYTLTPPEYGTNAYLAWSEDEHKPA